MVKTKKKKNETQPLAAPVILPANQDSEKPAYQVIAGYFKTFLQGCIATGIIILLAAKFYYHIDRSFNHNFLINYQYLEDILRLSTLDLVAKALAYSAGIDLAYMLLTPGPDEAIEPLILGLASAILYSISNIGDPDLSLAAEIGLYVLILSFLFLMKTLFIPKEEEKPQQEIVALLKSSFTDFIVAFKKRFNNIK